MENHLRLQLESKNIFLRNTHICGVIFSVEKMKSGGCEVPGLFLLEEVELGKHVSTLFLCDPYIAKEV